KTVPRSGRAEETSLSAIVVVGASSSTAILMNMNEAPQIAASRSRRATYPRIHAGYRDASRSQSRRKVGTGTCAFRRYDRVGEEGSARQNRAQPLMCSEVPRYTGSSTARSAG